MTRCHGSVVAALLACLAACGGSGSTGLVSPEGALLHQARRDRTCVTSQEMVTYCATNSPDAVAPDGTSAAGPFTPQPTATPGAGGGTPTASAGVPTASPAASSTPSVQPTPCQTGDGACPAPLDLTFVVRGLPEGAACALAARPAGSAGAWSTGTLVAAGGAITTLAAPLPGDAGPGLVEIALLCFEMSPAALPPQIDTLAAAAPDVVFAPADPVAVP